MKKINPLLFLLAAMVIFISCNKNKEDSKKDPDREILDSSTVIGFKDSTVLIKSITKLRRNISGNIIDSNTVFIYYDSLNRKINFNSEYTASPTPTLFSTVHSYNGAGLLVQLDRSDATGHFTNNYRYDAQNVITSATIELKPGVRKTEYFTKKILPEGGYSLSIKDSSNYVSSQRIDLYTFDFNAESQLILMSIFWLPNQRNGFVDSIFYDGFGNVSKVVETIYSSGVSPLKFTYFEFSDRATQGDQFYNFNQKVYNGISSFPAFFDDFAAGSPLTGLYNEGLYQFLKYPALSNKIYTWSINQEVVYITFKPESEYDNTKRLVKLKLYVGRDYDYATEYRLTYYK